MNGWFCKKISFIIIKFSEKIKFGDKLFLSYYLIGENYRLHKISAKILKLKQNIPNEVVWVMKDDSFINLIYFLSEENTIIPCNLLSKKEPNQKTSFNKIIEQNKQNDDNNIKSILTLKITIWKINKELQKK